MSDDTFLANNCLRCGEIMFLYEKVCYCDGPVEVVTLPLDKKCEAHYYPRRKLLYQLRGGNETQET
jgi:hypothetical protein